MNSLSYTSASVFPAKLLSSNTDITWHTMEHDIQPIHIQLNPTNKCNLNCSFCSCKGKDDAEMTFEQVSDILSRFRKLGTKAVTISGGGDPLCHPRINDIIDKCKDLGIEVGLVTNAILLPILKRSSDIKWCRISLSGEHLISKKAEEVIKEMPQVDWAFSYVMIPDNFSNVVEAVKLSNDLKVTHMRIVDDILDEGESYIGKAQEMIHAAGEDDSRVIYQGRKNHTVGTPKCLISLIKPSIDAHGLVFPCCIANDESVLLEEDSLIYPKSIDEVKIGDYAYGNGVIKGIHKKYNQAGLRITLKNGRQIVSSFDHTWLKAINLRYANQTDKKYGNVLSYDTKEISADDLRKGDLIPSLYDIQTKVICSEEDHKLVIAGYYMSKGWLGKDNYFGFAFGHNDLDMAEYVMEHIPNCKMYTRRTTYHIMGYDKDWYSYFSKFGERSELKRIAPFVFGLSHEQKELFIKSYSDCDGSIQEPSEKYNGHKIKFSSVSKKLSSDLVYLLSTMGIVTIFKLEEREVNCEDIYSINIGGNYNLEKLSFIRDKLLEKDRSQKRALGSYKTRDVMLSPIVSIEEVYNIDMVDIEVEGTNKFYSSFGVLLHNCGVQYALEEPSKSYSSEFCMGDNYEDIWNNQKFFDGSICVKCYYQNYNNMLGIMWDLYSLNHENFV
jgi:organic radical activating enzyme